MINPKVSIIFDYNKYRKYRSSFSQYKELYEITKSLNIPKLSKGERREVGKFFSNYDVQFKLNYSWHAFYSYLNGFDKRYIPIDFLFCVIVPTLNRDKWSNGYVDKNRYSDIFTGIKQPKTFFKRINGDFYIDKKIVPIGDIIDLCLSIDESVVKPSIDTGQGKGVNIFRGREFNQAEVVNYLNTMGKDFIVQERMRSHPLISRLNPTSLNTIRMVTYRRGNEAYILSSTMKIGKKGEIVDNGHSGGMFCGIRNGILDKYLYTLNPFTKVLNPDYPKEGEILLPNFSILEDKAKELALQLPYSRYAGWDLSIDEAGDPILIEVNLSCPGGNIMQIPNGPLFGDMTEEIMEDIKLSRK